MNNMSGKAFKQQRNEEEAKKAESRGRQEQFMKEVNNLSEKYRVELIAALRYEKSAIYPLMIVVDVKEKYEAMTAEAKKLEAEKAKQSVNGVTKPAVADETKLEV